MAADRAHTPLVTDKHVPRPAMCGKTPDITISEGVMTLTDTVPTGWASRLLIAGLIVAAGSFPAAAATASPTSLTDAIQLALQQNPGLLDSQSSVTKAQLSLQAAQAGTGITVTLKRTYGSSQFHLQGTGGSAETIAGEETLSASKPLGAGSLSGSIEWDPKINLTKDPQTFANPITYGLSLSEPLFPSRQGAAAQKLQSAKLDLFDQQQQLAADRDQLVLSVEAAYLSAKKHAADVTDAEYALNQAQAKSARIQAEASAGQAGASDVQSAKIAFAQAQASLDSNQYAAQEALESLDALLGLPPATAITLSDVTAPDFTVTLAAAQQQAAAQRSEIAHAERSLDDAQQALDQARKDAGLQVTGMADVSNKVGQPLLSADWSVGLEVDLPFFSGNNPQLAIQSAELDVQSATRKLAGVRRSVNDDVSNRFHDWLGAEQSLGITQLQLQQAKTQLDAVQQRYKAGLVTQDAVGDAQKSLADATENVAEATLALRIAVDKLRVAEGGHLAP